MKPYSFYEYELITYHKNNNKIYNIVFLLIIMGIFLIICNFKFNIYEKVLLFKNDGKYFLLVDITKDFNREKNSTLKINQKEYEYKILSDDETTSEINGTFYRIIPIDISDYKTNGEYDYVHYLLKSNTIINMIIEFTRGGNV